MPGSSFVRSAGQWLIIGALVAMGVGIKETLGPSVFGTMQNMITQGIVTISSTLVLVGVIGLARSGAAGEGALAKIGLGSAVLASALFIPLNVLVAVNEELGGLLLGLAAVLQGLGLLLGGIAVLRASHWSGWQRFTPLLCGLYTYLVLLPAVALGNGYDIWALTGWQIPFLLLGVALTQQHSVPIAEATVVGA